MTVQSSYGPIPMAYSFPHLDTTDTCKHSQTPRTDEVTVDRLFQSNETSGSWTGVEMQSLVFTLEVKQERDKEDRSISPPV